MFVCQYLTYVNKIAATTPSHHSGPLAHRHTPFPVLNRTPTLLGVITGAHIVIHTKDAEADRNFFKDVFGFDSVDAGRGWLIFALPPAEVAFHPGDESRHELYLMCDDIEATVRELAARGVELTRPVSDERFGLVTAIKIPGGELALYQPKHPTALPQ